MKINMRQIIQSAVEQGWGVEFTKKNHWRFVPPDPTKRMVVTGGTPSDSRSFRNFLADLRRTGLRV